MDLKEFEEYASKHTVNEIAEHFKISKGYTYLLLETNEINFLSKNKVSKDPNFTVKHIREVSKGKTIKEVAEHFGMSYGYMCKIINNFDIDHIVEHRAGRRKLGSYSVDEIVADYQNGMKLSAMAKKHKFCVESIRNILIKAGVYIPKKNAHKVQLLESRLKSVDAERKTEKELYQLCKDIYPNEKTFRQRLSTSGIKYKYIVPGKIREE